MDQKLNSKTGYDGVEPADWLDDVGRMEIRKDQMREILEKDAAPLDGK